MTDPLPLGPLGGAVGAAERKRRAAAWFNTATWRDPNGNQLSDRVWMARKSVRKAIDQTLTQAIVTGESPLVTARKLEQWLSPSWAPRRNESGRLVAQQPKRLVTATPGRAGAGSYAARRLARTEMTRAHGQATIEAARRNPFTRGVRWMLSAGHKEADTCNQYASHDEGLGRGVYPPHEVPSYPQHPHELCTLAPAQVEDNDAVVKSLREQFGIGQTPTAPANRLDIDALEATFDRNVYQDESWAAAENWIDGLTPSELRAAKYYKSSGYSPMNNYLRYGRENQVYDITTNTMRPVSDSVGALDAALAKSEIPTDAILQRGIRFDAGETPLEWVNIQEGDIIFDRGYVSTTTNPDIMKAFSVGKPAGSFEISIYAPKGASGAWLDPLGVGEYETVLPRGSTFRVHRVERPLGPDGEQYRPTKVFMELLP